MFFWVPSEILIHSLSENDRQEIFKGAYNEQREFDGESNSRFSQVVNSVISKWLILLGFCMSLPCLHLEIGRETSAPLLSKDTQLARRVCGERAYQITLIGSFQGLQTLKEILISPLYISTNTFVLDLFLLY